MVTTTRRSSFQLELQPYSTFQDSRERSAPQHKRGNRFLSLSLYIVVVVALAIDSSRIVPVVQGLLVTPHFKHPNLDRTSFVTLVHHHIRTISCHMNSGGDDATVFHTDPASTTTASATKVPPMRLIRGLQEVIHKYDIFFIDMWGVLHDGKQPYEHVLDAIRKMKNSSTDKVLILLSNSSKRYQHSISNLQQLGFHVEDFHSVITSGEVTYQMLESTIYDSDDSGDSVSSALRQWMPLQSILKRNKETTTKYVFILGSGDDDVPYCTRCGWTPTNNIYDAHVILARGPFTIPMTPNGKDSDDIIDNTCKVIDRRTDGEDTYQQTLHNILQIAAEQGVPMIISNPDKVRPDADRSPMPGQIGDLYTSILTKLQESATSSDNPSTIPIEPASMIKRIGKPFPDVYDTALQSLSDLVIDKSRICMIGDALETDITGGSMFGIDTIWVLKNGVHSIDIQKTLSTSSNSNDDILKSANVVLDTFNENNIGTYAEGKKLSPTFVIPYFQW